MIRIILPYHLQNLAKVHGEVTLDVSRDLLRKQSGELAKRLAELEADAHRTAEQPFNLDSPKQLQEILFGKLDLPDSENDHRRVLAVLTDVTELHRLQEAPP